MHNLVFNGLEAEVRWGYRRAISLGPWTLTAKGTDVTVSASIVTADTFAASQRPLVFVVPRPNKQPWRWSVESLQIADGRITAGLGPQE